MKRADRIITVIVVAFLIIVFIVLYSGISAGKAQYRSNFSKGQIVVVKLRGVIVSSDKIVNQLKKYSRRKDIKAIVLRINSPGGGVAASQEIYEEVKRVRKSGKPIVASIASVGASGGYYIALGANKIVANPGSITGSIGVIVDFPLIVDFLEKVGIEFKTVKSGYYKDLGSPYREFTDKDRAKIKEVVDNLFNQFVNVVAEERHLDKNDLLKVADGRIFTGSQAVEYGLIDTLGTLEDAILLAGKMAGIEGYPTVILPKRKKVSLIELLFSDIEEVLSILIPIPSLNYLWR